MTSWDHGTRTQRGLCTPTKQSTGQSVKTTHGKLEKICENNIKRNGNVSKATSVTEVRSHTVSVQCTCTMYAECESNMHKSHSCTAQHHAHARLMPKCTVSAVTHAVT